MKWLLLLVSVVTLHAAHGLIGQTQSSGVRGVLHCNGRPLPNTKVKLYDDDRGIDPDDLMAAGRTDGQGRFELSGHVDEITPIDPKLNIYHDCNDGIKPCQRKISIMIPDSYITPGKIAKRFYDAGVIELAGKFAGEKRDCFN